MIFLTLLLDIRSSSLLDSSVAVLHSRWAGIHWAVVALVDSQCKQRLHRLE